MRLIDDAGRDGRGVLSRTAEQLQRPVRPLEVMVRRVLPGDPDRAVQLDHLARGPHRRLAAVDLGRRGPGPEPGPLVRGGRPRQRRPPPPPRSGSPGPPRPGPRARAPGPRRPPGTATSPTPPVRAGRPAGAAGPGSSR